MKLLVVVAIGLALAKPGPPPRRSGGNGPVPSPPAGGWSSGKAITKDNLNQGPAGGSGQDPSNEGGSGDGAPPADPNGSIDPRDIHGEFRDSHREVDVDRVWSEGDMYFQGDLMVKVLSNGDGTYQVVIRDPSNMSGVPVTVMEEFTQNALDQRIRDGEWEDYS